jgi:hypothetical protein
MGSHLRLATSGQASLWESEKQPDGFLRSAGLHSPKLSSFIILCVWPLNAFSRPNPPTPLPLMSAQSLPMAQSLAPSSQVSSTTIHDHASDANSHLEKTPSYYVEFEPADERNPITYRRRKKWAITFTASAFTVLAAAAAGSYNMGFSSMIPDLNCTEFQATVGLSVFPVGE